MKCSAFLPAEVYGVSFESSLLMRAVAGLLASQMIAPNRFNDSCCVGAIRIQQTGVRLHRDLHGKTQSKHVVALQILRDELSWPSGSGHRLTESGFATVQDGLSTSRCWTSQ